MVNKPSGEKIEVANDPVTAVIELRNAVAKAAILPVIFVTVVDARVEEPEIVKLAPAMLPVEVILDAVEDPMVDEEVVRLVVNILVEVELVIVPLEEVRLVLVILLIVALLDDRLVIVDEAAVVVEKVEVAEKLAG